MTVQFSVFAFLASGLVPSGQVD